MPKKEKKISVSLSFPEYKLEALALALEEKGVSLEEELEWCGIKKVDSLFSRIS